MTTSFRLESGRVVIKIGSSLATLNGVPRTAWLSVLGEEIARLRQRGEFPADLLMGGMRGHGVW